MAEGRASFTMARVSPPGRSALAVIEVRGPGAAQAVGALCREGGLPGRAGYRVFIGAGGEEIDDGLVIVLPGQGDRGEHGSAFWLTVHGSPVVVEALVAELERLGGTRRGPQGEPGLAASWLGAPAPLLERELLDGLTRAASRGAARFLLEQRTTGLLPWVEAAIGEGSGRPLAERATAIAAVLEQAPRGRALFEPRRLVIAGPPNAGKSTLFNLLVGSDRVIADPEPGTTRDLIEELVLVGDYPVCLVDGAGLRATEDPVERLGVERMRGALRDADLVVLLVPPEQPHPARTLASELEAAGVPLLEVASKVDAGAVPGVPLAISARTGTGLPALREQIARRLWGGLETPSGATPCPFLARHERCLVAALTAARSGEDPTPALIELRDGSPQPGE